MALTAAQKATLKAYIIATPALNSQPNNSDGAFAIAEIINATATPDYWVWKTNLHEHELTGQTSPDGTVWSWTAYTFRSVSEQNGYARMFNSSLSLNPSLPNIRQGFQDIFSGGGSNAPQQRAHFLAMSRRKASTVEKLLVASGDGTTAVPGTMGFVGPITYADVHDARNS